MELFNENLFNASFTNYYFFIYSIHLIKNIKAFHIFTSVVSCNLYKHRLNLMQFIDINLFIYSLFILELEYVKKYISLYVRRQTKCEIKGCVFSFKKENFIERKNERKYCFLYFLNKKNYSMRAFYKYEIS